MKTKTMLIVMNNNSISFFLTSRSIPRAWIIAEADGRRQHHQIPERPELGRLCALFRLAFTADTPLMRLSLAGDGNS